MFARFKEEDDIGLLCMFSFKLIRLVLLEVC